MSAIPEFSELADNLSLLDDWEDRYRYIIELGQMLAPLAPEDRVDANKVSGCVSQVWLVIRDTAGANGHPVLSFSGDSDAMIVKGLIAILISIVSGRPAREISEMDILGTFDELGLGEHLSTQRSNGLKAMIARVQTVARERV